MLNFDVVGDKDELIGFGGQKVKGQGHSEMECTWHIDCLILNRFLFIIIIILG